MVDTNGPWITLGHTVWAFITPVPMHVLPQPLFSTHQCKITWFFPPAVCHRR